MNNEQIKEVMRLSDDIRTAHTSEWDVSDLVEAQNDLEAYLRTIGEPENTFPLNPNGSSKWAHLQKHDGAQAIGVVFRTGSGSVGSLVDGRVVWADWLAHPNGSKPESVNAELLEALKRVSSTLEAIGDLPSMKADVDAAIARAESAIETPAKVSPCDGHAVQLPDPLGLLSCTHPDCGRYEGPRSHECRAMADNACARPSICQGHAVQQDADEVISLAQALEQHRARKIVDAVSALPVGGKHEDSPSPFHAGYQLACDEVMHRLLTEEWDGCLTPPGKQEDDEAGGA